MISKIKNKAKKFLLWSQKYTKTDMLYLAKGGFWLGSGEVVASIFSFALAVTFANLIPIETFGTYKYILSIAGVLSVLSLPGLSTSLTRSIARGYDGSLMPTVKTAVKWASLGGMASLAVGLYYFLNNNSVLSTAFFLIAALIPLKNAFSLYRAYFEGKKLFKTETLYVVITQIISSGALIAMLFLTKNLFAILLTYFIPGILATLIFLIKTIRLIPKNSTKDPETINYGKHLSAMKFLGMVTERLDTILLWNLLGASSVAVYSFALAPIGQIKSYANNILPLAFPKLAQSTHKQLRKTLPYKLFVMFSIILAITLTYILAAPFLFKIFFPQYMSSVLYSQVFALSMLFMPRNLLMESFVALGEKKKLYLVNIIIPIIRIVLLITLIKFFGIWGAIYAFLLTQLFSLILTTYLFKKP